MLTRLSLFARRNVIALLALFVALGGTSVAAVAVLPKNSVGSRQIEPHSVTGGDIKLSSLTGKNVKNGSLGTTDLSSKARASLRGGQGPKGDQGAQGAAGTARAFAHVSAACTGPLPSTCPVTNAKNVTGVSRVATGDYCVAVTGLTPATAASMANVDFTGTTGPETAASALTATIGFSGCPHGVSDFLIVTQRLTAFNADAESDTVAFNFLVP